MANAIADLVELVNTRIAPSSVASYVVQYGDIDMRVMAINVLDWLQRQRRFRNQKGLVLNLSFPWCQLLVELAHEWCPMAELFEVQDNVFNFKGNVGLPDRDALQAIAMRYQPVVRI